MSRFSSSSVTHNRPSHPAYFTGNPFYFDALLTMNGYIQRIRDFQAQTNKPLEPAVHNIKWMGSKELSEKLSIKTTPKQVEDLHQKLNFLYSHISQFTEEEEKEIMSFLEKYMRPGSFFKRPVIEYPKLDEYNRSMTLGSRKTAKAQVYMIPGEGKVMVNGLHFSDYFDNDLELHSSVKALDAVDGWGKYNIWAVVNGGGKSSQANAIGLGIARGLIIQDPSVQDILKASGLLTPDTRQVERKKTGQPKARKKITWVKR